MLEAELTLELAALEIGATLELLTAKLALLAVELEWLLAKLELLGCKLALCEDEEPSCIGAAVQAVSTGNMALNTIGFNKRTFFILIALTIEC